jgi:hypothetical protein
MSLFQGPVGGQNTEILKGTPEKARPVQTRLAAICSMWPRNDVGIGLAVQKLSLPGGGHIQ